MRNEIKRFSMFLIDFPTAARDLANLLILFFAEWNLSMLKICEKVKTRSAKNLEFEAFS